MRRMSATSMAFPARSNLEIMAHAKTKTPDFRRCSPSSDLASVVISYSGITLGCSLHVTKLSSAPVV